MTTNDLIPGAVGRRHPVTAHDAANATSVKQGNHLYRQQILDLLLRRGDYGVTAAEAAQHVGISTQLAGSRFVELRGDGCAEGNPKLARRTMQSRALPGGKPGMVHVLTDEGVAEAKRLHRPKLGMGPSAA